MPQKGLSNEINSIIAMPLTDKNIKQDIIDQLTWDTRVPASGIEVEYSEGKAVLRGVVPNEAARIAAEEDVYIIPEVRDVENLLQISYVIDKIDKKDDDIRNALEKVLTESYNIDESKIIVLVEKGIVTLQGVVDLYQKKPEIEKLVISSPGVRDVINAIVIVPTKKVSDEIIADTIVRKLGEVPHLDIEALNLSVSEGVVTIRGNVPDKRTDIAVFKAIGTSSGVVGIRNFLEFKRE